MLGFSCSTWDLYLGHVGSSSLTRDGTPTPCIGSTESYPLDQQGSCFSLYFYFSFPASTLPDHSPTLRLPTPSSLWLCLSIYGLTPVAISLLVSLCLSLSPSPCLFPSLSVTHFSLSHCAFLFVSPSLPSPSCFYLLLFPSDFPTWCLPPAKEPDPSSLGLGQRTPASVLLPSPLSSPGDQGPQEWELGPRWPQAGLTGRRHRPDLGPSTAAAQAGSSPPAQRGSHSVDPSAQNGAANAWPISRGNNLRRELGYRLPKELQPVGADLGEAGKEEMGRRGSGQGLERVPGPRPRRRREQIQTG